jgi:hypothetical protein
VRACVRVCLRSTKVVKPTNMCSVGRGFPSRWAGRTPEAQPLGLAHPRRHRPTARDEKTRFFVCLETWQHKRPPRYEEACVSDGAIWMDINPSGRQHLSRTTAKFQTTYHSQIARTSFFFSSLPPLVVRMQTGVSRCHQSTVRF